MSDEYVIQYEGISLVIVDNKFISPGISIIEKDSTSKIKNKQKQK
jgi:hypothetical protein